MLSSDKIPGRLQNYFFWDYSSTSAFVYAMKQGKKATYKTIPRIVYTFSKNTDICEYKWLENIH